MFSETDWTLTFLTVSIKKDSQKIKMENVNPETRERSNKKMNLINWTRSGRMCTLVRPKKNVFRKNNVKVVNIKTFCIQKVDIKD